MAISAEGSNDVTGMRASGVAVLPRPMLLVALALLLLAVWWYVRDPLRATPRRETGVAVSEIAPVIERVNAHFARQWEADGIPPASAADDLRVLRRLTLALFGTIPSLEEIRAFEADRRPDRLAHWTRRFLADPRFADYFAERLARSYVGTDLAPFLIFRRDRLVAWLSEQLAKGTPYDRVARQLISERGLWTSAPATNFVTACVDDGKVDENKLAGRTVRAFLGQRIDCAQCHDHPFDHWKQHEFEGLAAFFAQVRPGLFGLEDKTRDKGQDLEFEVEDRKTLKKRRVVERVPFLVGNLPKEGTRRDRLARWLTHPENRRFERAIANRVWGLMFGRPYLEPVDGLSDPPETTDLLDLLGSDFREHGYNLRRLVQVIAGSQTFRLESRYLADEPTDNAEKPGTTGDASRPASSARQPPSLAEAARAWAVFPLIRLRPDQMIGSVFQVSHLQTIDQNSHLFIRLRKIFEGREFVEEYGDFGERELDDRAGTIPQRLLLMNGKSVAESIEPTPISAISRIASLAPNDAQCIETAFLLCLTRHPTPTEATYFENQIKGLKGDERVRIVEDLVWSLIDVTEFSWNH